MDVKAGRRPGQRPEQRPEQGTTPEPGFRAQFSRLLEDLTIAVKSVYGDRLVSLLVFGSVGRGKPRPDSDVDLLLIADHLPDGRIPRVRDFAQVEHLLESRLRSMSRAGVTTSVSPIFKTPEEVLQGSLLFLDMIEDAIVLFDRDRFAEQFLERLAARLGDLGARKLVRGGSWHWVLKPDYHEGEVFDI